MVSNPLVQSPAGGDSAGGKPIQVVHLVGNQAPTEFPELNRFLGVFNTSDVKAEVVPFKYVIQRRVKRGLGGKFAKGLTTEVTENIEVNLFSDLFGLRRWLGNIRNDPSNVLLFKVTKVKDDPLAVPLIFTELRRVGRPILVVCPDGTLRDQLLAQIDLTFTKVPEQVSRNAGLKGNLLARISRRKGFSASMRNLLDTDFLPEEVAKKVTAIATGGDASGLSEPEVVNLCLLADLISRYEQTLLQFKDAIENTNLQVPQLVSIFEVLTADMSVTEGLEVFKDFLKEAEEREEKDKIKTKAQLFGFVWRYLTGSTEGAKATSTERMAQVYRTIFNGVVKRRAQSDPLLWKRCHFLGAAHPAEQSLLKGVNTYLDKLEKALAGGNNGKSLQDAHQHTGLKLYELARLANKPDEQLRKEEDFVQQRFANQLLPMLRSAACDTDQYGSAGANTKASQGSVEQFLQDYQKHAFTEADAQRILRNVRQLLNPDDFAVQEIRDSVLNVLTKHAEEREQTLREIYILNAVNALVKYPFHLAERSLNSVEDKCAREVLPARMGLELMEHGDTPGSIELLTKGVQTKLGPLRTDKVVLCRAYARLISLRVEQVVRRMLDKKIGYFSSTFGESFFGTVHERVVKKFDIPLTQRQMADIVRSRNVMASLDTKGMANTQDAEVSDPFLDLGLAREAGKRAVEIPTILENFEKEYQESLGRFRALLTDLKNSAEGDPREDNPKVIIWSLFKRGILNLFRDESREAFRKSIYYKYLQDLIAKISSENYSVFHNQIVDQGIKIMIPHKYNYLIIVGERFQFLDNNQVVKYQLLPAPGNSALNEYSTVFVENYEKVMNAENREKWVEDLDKLAFEMNRAMRIWNRFSRNLSLTLLDHIIQDTVIRSLDTEPIQAKHLYYLDDALKLCLGRPTVGAEAAPFAKLLKRPELIGNIYKNANTSSTTIDDMAIEVHKIDQVWNELQMYSGVAEDLLDIVQGMGVDRVDLAFTAKYEQLLKALIARLEKPMREWREADVQALHKLAAQIKEVLHKLYTSPSSAKQRFSNRLQNMLAARRSDAHSLRINFTDAFIIDTAQVTVRRKVEKDGEKVAVQRKEEVELNATHQTLPLRIRELIRALGIIERKTYLAFSPEGQKKKQVQYVLDIIDQILTMRGNAVSVFVDTSMLEDSQVEQLATRVKPHNFFNMTELTPEVPPGMRLKSSAVNPLTGRPLDSALEKDPAAPPTPADAQADDAADELARAAAALDAASSTAPDKPAEAPAPAANAAPANGSNGGSGLLRCAQDPTVSYRYDAKRGAYFYMGEDRPLPARAVPVDLGGAQRSVILMVKLSSGRPAFHGLYGDQVLMPAEPKPQPPRLCTFPFGERQVSVFNEGGKPVVKLEPAGS